MLNKTSRFFSIIVAVLILGISGLVLFQSELKQKSAIQPTSKLTTATTIENPIGSKPTTTPELDSNDNEQSNGATRRFMEITLSKKEIEKFLSKHNRDAQSLITAFILTDDRTYFEEAIRKDPASPEVAMVALAVGTMEKDSVWIQRLLVADADNALAHYLSAYECFKRFDARSGSDALRRAESLQRFDDYRTNRLSGIEELAIDAGHPANVASAIAARTSDPTDSLLPKYLEFAEAVSWYLSSNRTNPSEVDWILKSSLRLGEELAEPDPGNSLILQAGAEIYDYLIYKGLNNSKPFPSLKESPKTLAEKALANKESLVKLQQQLNAEEWLNREDHDVIEYFRLKRNQGESTALLWASGINVE